MVKLGKKILLVEDDKDLLFLMSKKLTDAGFDVVTSETGSDALERVTKDMPELVLLDILLPDIDGLTVLNEISKNPKTKDLPVIILSNLADQGSLDQAAAIGKYEYLIKAKTDLNDVVEHVKKKLNIH